MWDLRWFRSLQPVRKRPAEYGDCKSFDNGVVLSAVFLATPLILTPHLVAAHEELWALGRRVARKLWRMGLLPVAAGDVFAWVVRRRCGVDGNGPAGLRPHGFCWWCCAACLRRRVALVRNAWGVDQLCAGCECGGFVEGDSLAGERIANSWRDGDSGRCG